MVNYGEQAYWNRRYAKEADDPFDWLFSYQDVKELIDFIISDKKSSILMIGCGNAPFSNDM